MAFASFAKYVWKACRVDAGADAIEKQLAGLREALVTRALLPFFDDLYRDVMGIAHS